MTNFTWLVAKREYLKIVRRPSFWAVVLLIPTLYIGLIMVMGEMGKSAEKKIKAEAANAKNIIVVDQSGLINNSLIIGPLHRSSDPATARQAVITGQADAAFIYGADIQQTKVVKVIVPDTSIVSRGRFDAFATSLVKQSILADIGDPARIALFNSTLSIDREVFKGGVSVIAGIEGYIVPIISVIVYFLLVMMSSSYMLMSVRGKIVGLSGLAFTQVFTLAVYGVVAVLISSRLLPIQIDWSLVHFSLGQLLTTGFFLITGFLFMASAMVGLGAAMPTYRDSSQFSAIFIMLSIMPIYMATSLAAEPAGVLARTFSYIPFTGPLILMFRSAIDALPGWELAIGLASMVVYTLIGFYLALQLFNLGSMEFTKKISITALFKRPKT
jgi:ABC-2 type transport system permease protein